MITTVFQIALLRLWNNKQELMLTFVVPILFFSIFALIFSRGVGSDTPAIKVAVVDDDQTQLTQDTVRRLREQSAITLKTGIAQSADQGPLENLGRRIIRENGASVVIHFPQGLQGNLDRRVEAKVGLLSEGTNPVARQIVQALLAQSLSAAMASNTRRAPAPPTVTNPDRVASEVTQAFHFEGAQTASASSTQPAGGRSERVSFDVTEVFGANKHNPKIAMYAAGIAVMFLLFSASGAGGSLLEEYEAGTLDRLLCSHLTVTKLLLGKWLFITALGCVQLTVMFVWAQLVFQVDVLGHFPGFAVMAFCTAAATASLALCLAVLCRSRSQLNGVSIVLILTMSALGGSMVPRYVMSEQMQRLGKLTFNGWALDGFQKVFWYDLPVSSLTTEAAVLGGMALYLAVIARVFADRWAPQ